jgi:hypothetical protein
MFVTQKNKKKLNYFKHYQKISYLWIENLKEKTVVLMLIMHFEKNDRGKNWKSAFWT